MIEKLSKFWAAAIAYVALLTGAGLSVAGNVADTFRTRGAATDTLDIILAAAWPILVLLTIELFVSRRWSPLRGFQMLRWLGCVMIGLMAMIVSWVHLHDLLSSRGQLTLVSIVGPLAIDGMAIMATGLVLSTRGRYVQSVLATAAPVATEAVATPVDAGQWTPADDEAVAKLDEDMWGNLASRLDTSTTPAVPLDVIPTSPAPAGVRPESVPSEATELIMAWHLTAQGAPPATAVDELLAGHFGVKPRTIRRWRATVVKAAWF